MSDEVQAVAENQSEVATESVSPAEPQVTPTNAEESAKAESAEVGSLLMSEGEAEGKTSEAESDNEEEAKEQEDAGAPEEYAEFTQPEGVKLDGSVMDAYKGVAKELNLSQEKAQKLVDQVAPVLAKRQLDFLNDTNRQWVERVKSDKEIGGDNFKPTMACAFKALNAFKDEKGAFKDKDVEEIASIAGNHPGLIKIMRFFGSKMSEDHWATGKKPFKFTPDDVYK